jgi:predicted nucleotidyltransferase component of viral defense system
MISKQDILDRAIDWGLRPEVVEKDYVLGWLLAGIAIHPHAGRLWVFKGGTCLKKCFFETYRFSEDLDFSLLAEASYTEGDLLLILREIGEATAAQSGIQFGELNVKTRQNRQGQQTFEGRIHYRGPLQIPNWPKVSLDITQHETLFPPFASMPVHHAYPDELPAAAMVQTYSFEELFAEKLRALIERTRPRDLYDVVYLLDNRFDAIPLDRARIVFSAKCQAKGFEAPSPKDILAAVRSSGELRADWESMLAHQLPQLPAIDSVLQRLDGRLDWLIESARVPSAPPAPIALRAGETLQAPPGVTYWGTSGLEAIRFAGANRLVVEFDYQGERRTVEPYSLRRPRTGNLLLYVFDRGRGAVRAFKVNEIANVRVSQDSFVPRFSIELSPGGPLHAPEPHRATPPRALSSSHNYVYACYVCGREFRHAVRNTALRKHQSVSGEPCYGRSGYLVRVE